MLRPAYAELFPAAELRPAYAELLPAAELFPAYAVLRAAYPLRPAFARKRRMKMVPIKPRAASRATPQAGLPP